MKKLILVLIVMLTVSVSAMEWTNDKVGHGFGSFMLNLPVLGATAKLTNIIGVESYYSIPATFIITAGIGFGIEYFQKNNPKYGSYNEKDLIADLVGCVLAIPLNCYVFHINFSKEAEYRKEQYRLRYGTDTMPYHTKCPIEINLRGKE